jgi:4-oxalocrotonate tautomerase
VRGEVLRSGAGECDSDRRRSAFRRIDSTTMGARKSASVSFEEVAARDWAEAVYPPDIAAHPERLYKKPAYRM